MLEGNRECDDEAGFVEKRCLRTPSPGITLTLCATAAGRSLGRRKRSHLLLTANAFALPRRAVPACIDRFFSPRKDFAFAFKMAGVACWRNFKELHRIK